MRFVALASWMTVVAVLSFGQPLAIGVKGGLRLNGDIEGDAVSESKRYVVGPMVEMALPHSFGVEFDALYSRGYRTSNSDILGGYYFERVRANTWEFPILVRRTFHEGGIRPYASIGYAPRKMSGSFHTVGVSADFAGRRTPYDFSGPAHYDVTHGFVAGGGIDIQRGHLRASPEVRYTRWNQDPVNVFGSHGYYISGNQNEVRILLGLCWR
jgi:hypothetical protein